jgi:pyruvate formate lyase activating enzyme
MSRKKYVDAVVVSGGEPCMHKELPKFLCKLKEHGFSVKLDTNGFYPEVLEECLPYADYIAMDIKTSPEKYKLLGATDTSNLMKSVEILKSGVKPFEFRTTIVPEIVTAQDINRIAEIIRGSKTHALQQFVAADTLEKRFQLVKPYPPETLNEFAKILEPFTENVELRM